MIQIHRLSEILIHAAAKRLLSFTLSSHEHLRVLRSRLYRLLPYIRGSSRKCVFRNVFLIYLRESAFHRQDVRHEDAIYNPGELRWGCVITPKETVSQPASIEPQMVSNGAKLSQ